MTEGGQDETLVLIVDDDADMRLLLTATLAGAGMRPIAVASGGEALAVLDAINPDLILLDAVMPPPDGFETCRLIKQKVGMAAVPVMFMTGLTETEHVLSGLRAGGVDYVTKPPLLAELIARVKVHVATARMTRSAQRALDTAGRRLLATDDQGRIFWSTPQASQLLVETGLEGEDTLSGNLLRMIQADQGHIILDAPSGQQVEITAIAPVASEYFFRVREWAEGMETAILRDQLGLTPRESDVLRWIAAGKPNKDIGEILNISARTVNKHLDQIYVKLGVENRSAAASIASRLIATHG